MNLATVTPPKSKLAPECLQHPEAAPEDPKPTETPEEETMLLPKQTLRDGEIGRAHV